VVDRFVWIYMDLYRWVLILLWIQADWGWIDPDCEGSVQIAQDSVHTAKGSAQIADGSARLREETTHHSICVGWWALLWGE
jgi:hypothetical protein